jgi:hypothetical protein
MIERRRARDADRLGQLGRLIARRSRGCRCTIRATRVRKPEKIVITNPSHLQPARSWMKPAREKYPTKLSGQNSIPCTTQADLPPINGPITGPPNLPTPASSNGRPISCSEKRSFAIAGPCDIEALPKKPVYRAKANQLECNQNAKDRARADEPEMNRRRRYVSRFLEKATPRFSSVKTIKEMIMTWEKAIREKKGMSA